MKFNHKYKYYTMEHRGSLEEALLTLRRITKFAFIRLIKNDLYDFYSYDSRINANRYILYSMPDNLGLPTWLIEFLD